MDNKSNRMEKLLKYFSIFSWSLAVVTLIIYIISIKVHANFTLFNFINDELTFILMPFIYKWLYQIRKRYNNG